MNTRSSGYSADVSLRVNVNGDVLSPAQVGSDRLIFDDPISLPPGPAEMIVRIDDAERRWRIEIGPPGPDPCVVPITLLP